MKKGENLMKKGLSDTKRYFIIGIMAIVLVIAFLLAVLPVTANAEANTGITSNEATYKELTDDDQLSGLDVTLIYPICSKSFTGIVPRQKSGGIRPGLTGKAATGKALSTTTGTARKCTK